MCVHMQVHVHVCLSTRVHSQITHEWATIHYAVAITISQVENVTILFNTIHLKDPDISNIPNSKTYLIVKHTITAHNYLYTNSL